MRSLLMLDFAVDCVMPITPTTFRSSRAIDLVERSKDMTEIDDYTFIPFNLDRFSPDARSKSHSTQTG